MHCNMLTSSRLNNQSLHSPTHRARCSDVRAIRPHTAAAVQSWSPAPSKTCQAIAPSTTTVYPPGSPYSKPRLVYAGSTASDGMSPDKTQFGDRLEGHMIPPPISKTDQEFEDMGLEFVTTREGIVLTELNDLFEKVGFPRRDPERLRIALENTYHLIWIRATRQSRLARVGQMVGFARATSDGVLSATIWDVAILPSWQRGGLGRALMERLTSKLVEDDIPTITLYAEPNVIGLYEKLGFMKDPDGIRGMAFQRKKKSKAGARQPALMR